MLDYAAIPIPDRASGWKYDPTWPISTQRLGAAGDCVELTDFGLLGKNAYYGGAVPMYPEAIPHSIPHLYARRMVAEALALVDRRLSEGYGLRLFVLDAYRPFKLQEHMFTVWYRDYLREKQPAWTEDEIDQETRRIWALPSIDPTCPSPHLTGAAVDVWLYNPAAQELCDLGVTFDEGSPATLAHFFEDFSRVPVWFSSVRAQEARWKRRILTNAMAEEGFVFYPEEPWHFSLGDQEWGQAKNCEALFSIMSVPAE